MTVTKNTSTRRCALQTIGAAGVAATACSCGFSAKGSSTPHLISYDESQLASFVYRVESLETQPYSVIRNSQGSAAFVDVLPESPGHHVLAVNSDGSVRKLTPPARRWVLNDNLEFVAWYDDSAGGMRLAKGNLIKLRPTEVLGFALGAEYYSITERGTNSSKLYRLSNPGAVAASAGFESLRVYSQGGRVFWFGYDSDYYIKTRERREIVCRCFSAARSALVFEEEVRIMRPQPAPSPFVVTDLDPWSGNVLCTDVRHGSGAEWYVYSFVDKRLSAIGKARPFGLFLEADLLALVRKKMVRR